MPSVAGQTEIQDLLYNKLSVGVFDDPTRAIFLEIIDSLTAQGAQAVILGCTEFPILLKDASCSIPLIDTLKCHSEALVRFILDKEM